MTNTLASFPGWYEGERMYLGMRLSYQPSPGVANPFIAKLLLHGLTLLQQETHLLYQLHPTLN